MFTYPICPPPCRFNTTPRRLLVAYLFKMARIKAFQYTAARRRLETAKRRSALCSCFNTQPPEGGWAIIGTAPSGAVNVSTHSRPKAAGLWAFVLVDKCLFQHTAARRRLGQITCRFNAIIRRFNTQPPEGGWINALRVSFNKSLFQHTAARRRLRPPADVPKNRMAVSTHSRPKAAASRATTQADGYALFQHTAARRRLPGVSR